MATTIIDDKIMPIINSNKILKVSPDNYTFFVRTDSFCSANEVQIFDQIKKDLESNNEVSIYIHFPVCKYICGFCHYPKKKDGSSLIDKSAALLVQEINRFKEKFPEIKNKMITSFYIGGGTPTLMSKEQLRKIIGAFEDCKFSDGCEKTIEGTPDTLSKGKVQDIQKAGFNRVSMGIQTLDEEKLSSYQRDHKKEDSLKALGVLLQNKIRTNIDLIYGFPDQTIESVLNDIDTIININGGPSSITLYRLRLTRIGDDETPVMKDYKRNPDKFPTQVETYKMKLAAAELLKEKGYIEGPIGWFHKKGEPIKVYEDRWKKQIPLFGFGWKAYSYSQNMQCQNEKDFDMYHYYVESRKELPIYCGEILNDKAKKKLAFFMKHGEPFVLEQSEYEALKILIDEMAEKGFIDINENGNKLVSLTKSGNILVEEILSSFIYHRIQVHPGRSNVIRDVI